MDSSQPFSVLVRGLRAGETEAVRQLVAHYEPYLRRTIRRRLARTPLQAVADSADICQSALGDFLIRFVAGDFEVATQEDLTKLLLGIAKKKLAQFRRREGADRRDRNRTHSLGSDPQIPDLTEPEPSKLFARLELLDEVKRRIGAAEGELFQLRHDGHTWDEIAVRLGEPAARLRKRLSRAVQAVCAELGLESTDE